jgi:hypothetical protein
VHSLLGSANCGQPILVELRLSRSEQLMIAVLEGSGVDESLEERDDHCVGEVLVALFLVERAELALKIFRLKCCIHHDLEW